MQTARIIPSNFKFISKQNTPFISISHAFLVFLYKYKPNKIFGNRYNLHLSIHIHTRSDILLLTEFFADSATHLLDDSRDSNSSIT